ncbi:hypothetical protein GN956_G712 [Arapaima gigas]
MLLGCLRPVLFGQASHPTPDLFGLYGGSEKSPRQESISHFPFQAWRPEDLTSFSDTTPSLSWVGPVWPTL